MEMIDRALTHLKKLYGSTTPAARAAVALLAAAVVAGLACWGAPGAARPDSELMRGVPISRAELPAMEAALAKAKLADYEIRGTSIFVPRGREAAYMAALANANALPPRPGEAMTKAVSRGGPFMGSREREEQIKTAKQEELSLMIRSMCGIENAYVIYDEDAKPGFGEEKLITATASVKPTGAARLDEARVLAIRHLVAGAIAGLKPENVTVCDLNGGTWHGKLERTQNTGRQADHGPVPPPERETAATAPPQAPPERESTPAQSDRSEPFFGLGPAWGAAVLLGFALIGLLAFRSIGRGKSPDAARPGTLKLAGEGGYSARPAPSAVPAPHWPLTDDAAGRSTVEELSRMIEETPDAAANVLRNWIGQAS